MHLYVPKPAGNDLRDAIVDMLAARAVIAQRGGGHGASGEEARRGMETRENFGGRAGERAGSADRGRCPGLRGGGAEMKEATLAARLEAANDIARKRLFPRFGEADFAVANWSGR